MKIEKLNENQIRCTLTHADLAARHLKLSELAYGTENAKSLFRDMMQQASFDFGFEADDIPLMIEAIPASAGSIVLIITKVEDPEELDTRFSKFTPFGDAEQGEHEPSLNKLEGAEEFLDLLNKVKEAAAGVTSSAENPDAASLQEVSPARLFSFENIDCIMEAARLILPMYDGQSTLYHDLKADLYILALTQPQQTGNAFNKICNMLSEYGTLEKATGPILAYLEEHCETMISTDAIPHLASI